MIDEKIQDNTVTNGVPYFFDIFRIFLVKLRMQLSDLHDRAETAQNDVIDQS